MPERSNQGRRLVYRLIALAAGGSYRNVEVLRRIALAAGGSYRGVEEVLRPNTRKTNVYLSER